MRLRSFSAACAAAAAATCAIAPVAAGATEATPRELVEACRTMIPADVEAEGRIILRNRRGIVQA